MAKILFQLLLGCSQILFVDKLSVKAPDGPTKNKILKEIATEHNVTWEPEYLVEPDPKETVLMSGASSSQSVSGINSYSSRIQTMNLQSFKLHPGYVDSSPYETEFADAMTAAHAAAESAERSDAEKSLAISSRWKPKTDPERPIRATTPVRSRSPERLGQSDSSSDAVYSGDHDRGSRTDNKQTRKDLKALQDKIDILIADKFTQEQLNFVGNPYQDAPPGVNEVEGLEDEIERLVFGTEIEQVEHLIVATAEAKIVKEADKMVEVKILKGDAPMAEKPVAKRANRKLKEVKLEDTTEVAFCIHKSLSGIGVPHEVLGDIWVCLELERGVKMIIGRAERWERLP
uniref:Uncharacterized protein n=1 Tax=Brassica oleracea var. oleracea TaxID=109376 RepID=A0A0D3B7J1_BRAOL